MVLLDLDKDIIIFRDRETGCGEFSASRSAFRAGGERHESRRLSVPQFAGEPFFL